MAFTLRPLPYAINALAPHISAETLEFHHGQHHKNYIETLNQLIAGTPFENASLEDIVRGSTGQIFNNAAQSWNHDFFWNCLAPAANDESEKAAEREPKGELLTAIKRDFGSFQTFKKKFSEAAIKQFGSGWAWLVKDVRGRLKIAPTANAGNPLTRGLTPLLACDVWEHAYYIDYRNRRAEFIDAFWKLANWDFVSVNYRSREPVRETSFRQAPSEAGRSMH